VSRLTLRVRVSTGFSAPGPRRQRSVDLDPTAIKVFKAWREWQKAEQNAAGVESEGWMFTETDGEPVHPHSISQTFERSLPAPGRVICNWRWQ